MSENTKFWLIVLAVVVFLFLIVPEFMKGVLLLLSFPVGLFLFSSLIGGFQSIFEKRKKKEAEKKEAYRNLDAVRALEYHSIKSRGEYHNGWARVVIADQRYTYVREVNGVMGFIKPDSTFYVTNDIYTGGKKTVEIKHTEHANFFEEAEEFYHQSAIVKRDGKVALLGVDGKYIIPFDNDNGEVLFSYFNILNDNCLFLYQQCSNKSTTGIQSSVMKTVNRDGTVLYEGALGNQRIENNRLIIQEGGYRKEIDPISAKIMVPFNVYSYILENDTVLFYTIKEKPGWNVFNPVTQNYLLDDTAESIVYLTSSNSYLVEDNDSLSVYDVNGNITNRFPSIRMEYIYDQRYFWGNHRLIDIEGSRFNDLSIRIEKIYYDLDSTKECICLEKNREPRRIPKKPPFTKTDNPRILFIEFTYNYSYYLLAVEGRQIIGRYDWRGEIEYDQSGKIITGFRILNGDRNLYQIYSIKGELVAEEEINDYLERKHKEITQSSTIKPSVQDINIITPTEIEQTNRILFFDTETTGLPRNYNAPVSDLDNWPRLVQLSWIVTDANGDEFKVKDFIIKPDGFTIPDDSSKVHGITTEIALRDGNPLQKVLAEFVSDIETADMIVGHNVEFDKKIVGAEFLRCKIQSKALDKRTVCTMKSSTNYCALPGKYGYKWPTLQELHNKLFGESFEDAHNSLNDIKATKKCFFELREIGIIS